MTEKAQGQQRHCCEFDEEFVETQNALEKTKEAQKYAEIAAEQVHERRLDYHLLSEDYVTVEDDLNEGLSCIRRDTADEYRVLRNERQGQQRIEVPSRCPAFGERSASHEFVTVESSPSP